MARRGADLGGDKEYRAALLQVVERVERATGPATTQAALHVERTGKRVLRTYTHPPGTATTSPPGMPPALVTGNLRRSWRSKPARPGRKPHTFVAESGPTASYSRAQELGATIVGAFGIPGFTVELPARPFVKPAVLAAAPGVRRIYKRRWTEAILS